MCHKQGVFHLECEDGSVIPVSMYYSPECTETVISPTNIVHTNAQSYDFWWQITNKSNYVSPPLVASIQPQYHFTNTTIFGTSRKTLQQLDTDRRSIVHRQLSPRRYSTAQCITSGTTDFVTLVNLRVSMPIN